MSAILAALFPSRATVKFRKNAPPSKIPDDVINEITTTLRGSGTMKDIIRCPEGEEVNEWIATKLVTLFNDVQLLLSVVEDCCSTATCPVMDAGAQYEYRWVDDEKYKKVAKVPARDYAKLMCMWIERQIQDPSIFPVSDKDKFPKDFHFRVKRMFVRMTYVFAHYYHSHVDHLRAASAFEQFNSTFKQLVLFGMEFTLLKPKHWASVASIVESIKTHTDIIISEDDAKAEALNAARNATPAAVTETVEDDRASHIRASTTINCSLTASTISEVEEPKAEEAKEETKSEEADVIAEEPKIEEAAVAEELKVEEAAAVAAVAEEPKVEEAATAEEPKAEEAAVVAEEPKAEEAVVAAEEPKVEEAAAAVEETKVEEAAAVAEEPKAEEATVEEPKAEEAAAVEEPKAEEPKTEEPKTEEPKTVEAVAVEEPKAEESSPEEPKVEKSSPETEAAEKTTPAEAEVASAEASSALPE